MHIVHGISIISEKGIFLSSFFLFHTNNKFPTVITSLIMLRSMLVVTLCKLNDVHISGSALTRPSSPVRQVRRAPDHFFGRICYPPYHFFAVSAASVVITCDLNPSNHQKCRVLLIRLSLTHVVALVISRHSQGVKTIRPVVTRRAKQCNYNNDTCLILVVIVNGLF